jgi:hypothetical protein
MARARVGDFVVPRGSTQHWLVVLIRYPAVGGPYYVCFRNGVKRNIMPEEVK